MFNPPAYCLCVQRDFVAQHYLIGGDWGAENLRHSHHFVLELRLHGSALDQHGYMVDIVDVERELQAVLAVYRDQTLNDLAPFAGLIPALKTLRASCAPRWPRACRRPPCARLRCACGRTKLRGQAAL